MDFFKEATKVVIAELENKTRKLLLSLIGKVLGL